jgi:hypothetical protein
MAAPVLSAHRVEPVQISAFLHVARQLEAGFARAQAQASVRGGGTLEVTRDHARHMRSRLAGPAGWGLAIAQGWVTPEEVDELEAEIVAWASGRMPALPCRSTPRWAGSMPERGAAIHAPPGIPCADGGLSRSALGISRRLAREA